jgi:hypothetical protein
VDITIPPRIGRGSQPLLQFAVSDIRPLGRRTGLLFVQRAARRTGTLAQTRDDGVSAGAGAFRCADPPLGSSRPRASRLATVAAMYASASDEIDAAFAILARECREALFVAAEGVLRKSLHAIGRLGLPAPSFPGRALTDPSTAAAVHTARMGSPAAPDALIPFCGGAHWINHCVQQYMNETVSRIITLFYDLKTMV